MTARLWARMNGRVVGRFKERRNYPEQYADFDEDDGRFLHGLAERGVDFFVVVGGFEDFAGFGAVGGADEAVALHHVDEVGGATVADAQAALEE